MGLHLEKKRKKITEILVEVGQWIRVDDLKILPRSTGSVRLRGFTFLADLGETQTFQSHKPVIAFAGLDPPIYQLGQFEGISRISKRRNRRLRLVIFLMMTCVIRRNSSFREYFL